MGVQNHKLGLDHEGGAGLTHTIRLRFCRSCDGSDTAYPLAHGWADVHSTLTDEVWAVDDVPVNALDFKTMKILCTIVDTYHADPAESPSNAMLDALRDVMRAAWGDDVVGHIFEVFMGPDATPTNAVNALVRLLKANAPLYGVL